MKRMSLGRLASLYFAGGCGLLIAAVGFYWVQSAELPSTGAGRVVDAPRTPAAEFTNRLIIKAQSSSPSQPHGVSQTWLAELSAFAGFGLENLRPMSGGAHVLRLPRELPLAAVTQITRRLELHPDIAYAEPDRRIWPAVIPNDPRFAEQWHLFEDAGGMRLSSAWDTTTGNPGVVVAVLDTGILANHPDLTGRTLPGFDFISNFGGRPNDGDGRDADPGDPGNWVEAAGDDCSAGTFVASTWHGTHVAGSIAASADNGLGIAGINWVSKVLPVRVLGKCGGFFSDVVDGMRWAVGMEVPGVPANPNPARVLNLSLAARSSCVTLIQGAVNDVIAAGAVVVAGVGNNNDNAASFTPANCRGVMAVAATTRSGARAAYSNFGARVDISAPGGLNGTGSVLSTSNTGTTGPATHNYRAMVGTSMAAAQVSGVASLVLSANPGLTPAGVLSTLQATARAFPDGSCTPSICGAGIIDAAAAVMAVATTGNNPPVVSNGTLSTNENTAVTGNLDASDPDGNALSFSLVTNPIQGSVVITDAAMGAFIYTPNPGAKGTDSFTFKANDGLVDSNTATVTVNINNAVLRINAGGGAYTDSQGQLWSADTGHNGIGRLAITSTPIGGTVDDVLLQSLRWDPAGAPELAYSFNVPNGAYTVNLYFTENYTLGVGRRVFDVEIEGQPVLVGLDVYSEVGQDAALVKRLPVTVSDGQLNIRFVHGIENPMVSAIEVLGQAGVVDTAAPSVPRNLSATAISSTEVELGWVASVDTGGSGLGGYKVFRDGIEIATTLAPSYTDSALQPNTLYVYAVLAFDNAGNQSTQSAPPASAATLPSLPVNSPPAATNGTLITDENTAASGILSASDADGDALSFSVVTHGTLGSAVITDATTGAFTYLPNAGVTGNDSFTFKVYDGTVDSNTATVSVTINAVNGAPVATSGSLITNEDTPASGTLSASDPDGDALSFSLVTNAARGSVVITNAATGAFSYTPNAGVSGRDSFNFKTNDGTVDSNTATVSVTINAVNDAPVTTSGSLTTNEDTAASGTLSASDADGDVLSFSLVTNGTLGTAVIINLATGAFSYTPNAGVSGSDSFTFKVNDGTVDSNTATVSVTINAVNDAPVATSSSLTTDEDTPTSGTLSASDPDGDALTYSVVTNGTLGTAVITNAATGAFTYTPNLGATGSDSFTFLASDGQFNTTVGTVSVTINVVNGSPVTTDEILITDENVPASGTLSASDPDGDALSFSLVTNGTLGSAVITDAAEGAFIYTPNPGAKGTDSFTFKANDGLVDSSTATVTVNINAVLRINAGGGAYTDSQGQLWSADTGHNGIGRLAITSTPIGGTVDDVLLAELAVGSGGGAGAGVQFQCAQWGLHGQSVFYGELHARSGPAGL